MVLLRSLALTGVVLTAGCVAVTTLDGERLAMRSPEFRAYVESVFRAQNRVATELAFALESDVGPAAEAELESAELGLIDACAGLNQIAIGRRDGTGRSGLGRVEAARRAPDCERAARAAEAAIASVRQQPPDTN
jgi:hypothetical protein